MNGVGEFALVFSWGCRVSFISCRASTNAGSTCYIFSICSSTTTKVCFHTIIFRSDHNAFYISLFFHLWSHSVVHLNPISLPRRLLIQKLHRDMNWGMEVKMRANFHQLSMKHIIQVLIVYSLWNLGPWWWIGDGLYVLDSCCWRNVSIFST